jgi:hypothetical protein
VLSLLRDWGRHTRDLSESPGASRFLGSWVIVECLEYVIRLELDLERRDVLCLMDLPCPRGGSCPR